ncbi:MAG TPA: DUF378 domain-containing protein [Candidatus Saccharimonadales bacterium]
MKMNAADYVAWLLVVVGGLNWGLVGAFKYNLVDKLFGVGSGLSRAVYVLVGLSAIYMLVAVLVKSSKGATTK